MPNLPCAADAERLCAKSEKPTVENDFNCLSLSFNSLQKSCQDFIAKKLAHKPCTKDVLQYCQGVDRNLDRSSQCLRTQLTRLSSACNDWITKSYARAQSATKNIEAACAKDMKVCREFKGPAMGKCMDSLYSQKMLSKECVVLYEQFRLKNLRR